MDKELKNKIIIGIVVGIIIVSVLTIIFINKFSIHEPRIVKSIKNDSEVVLLFEDRNCNDCSDINNVFTELKVKKYLVYKDNNKTDYDKIIKQLGISEEEIISPTIIYVKENKMVANLVEIKEVDKLQVFLDNYDIK